MDLPIRATGPPTDDQALLVNDRPQPTGRTPPDRGGLREHGIRTFRHLAIIAFATTVVRQTSTGGPPDHDPSPQGSGVSHAAMSRPVGRREAGTPALTCPPAMRPWPSPKSRRWVSGLVF